MTEEKAAEDETIEGIVEQPGGPEDQDRPSGDDGGAGEDDLDPAEERDPYKRRVAVILAVLGVVGAWIGILHTDSGNHESTFARETTRTAVGSLRANVNQSTVAGLGTDLDAEQAAIGVAAQFQTGVPGAEVDAAAAQDLAEETELSSTAAAGIDQADRAELERDLTVEAHRMDLRREALAETRVTYNNRTSQYETVLTTLAVALFLVGFTLVLSRRVRPPVLVPGLLLAVYVAGWALWIHQRDIPTTSDAAIDVAAEAAMQADFGDFEASVTGFTDAIDLDDDFVAAYTGRSIAGFLVVNPDFLDTLAVVETKGPEVDRARDDVERAIDLGESDDFGSLVVSGIYRFYDGNYDGAVDRFLAAVDLNGQAPEAFLLLTAAELARGDTVAADAALEEAVGLLDLQEASASTREFSADLFTLLEQVQAAVPERAEDVDAGRGRLAVGEGSLVFDDELSGEAPDGVEFELADSDFSEGVLSADFTYTGLPEGSAVSLYVYEQPRDGVPFAQASDLARFLTIGGSGGFGGEAEVVRACEPVAFRYDFYVDGGFVTSIEGPGGEATC